VKRRFDVIETVDDVLIVDDYAHHPTEIKATVGAAREAGFDRVWVVFQPHRYTRTEALAREFASAFDQADRVVMMDVYSAGETPIPGVTGKTLVDAVLSHKPRTRMAYLPHRTEVPLFLARELREGDLVMTMGAGDVTVMGPEIARALAAKPEVARA
jgi:UDP-N-acetylmuramate--alanine ligase